MYGMWRRNARVSTGRRYRDSDIGVALFCGPDGSICLTEFDHVFTFMGDQGQDTNKKAAILTSLVYNHSKRVFAIIFF